MLGDFVLLYPLYALLFVDAGLSTAQVSALFALWSVVAFVLEVPSGALADATSRRALLVIAQLLTATAFALWMLTPSFGAFAAGFVLWGTAGALQSGALEALVYEELDHCGAADSYARVIGRATALGTVSATLAMASAAPVLAIGGFAAVGIASVVACLGAAIVAATLPEHRASAAGKRSSGAGDAGGGVHAGAAGAGVLRAGIAELRARPEVRRALVLCAAVTAVWGSLDEYVPLLADETGAGRTTVPLLFGLVYVGVALGGVLGGAAARLSRSGLGGVVAVGSIALMGGALTGTPAGFAGVAVGFCALQAATVAADARLQSAITGPARATVTSLAGLATEAVVLVVFASYGLGSTVMGDGELFALLAAPYLVLAAAVARRGRGGGQGG